MMTTDVYSLAIGFSLAFITVVGSVGTLMMWYLWFQARSRRSSGASGRGGNDLPAWGEPDLAPPSTSAEARAEVAQLEELWRRRARRRHTTLTRASRAQPPFV